MWALNPPGIGVADGCEPSHECWKLKADLLKQWSMPLTTEATLQPYPSFFFKQRDAFGPVAMVMFIRKMRN